MRGPYRSWNHMFHHNGQAIDRELSSGLTGLKYSSAIDIMNVFFQHLPVEGLVSQNCV